MTQYDSRSNEHGFAIGLILLAVVLIAAIVGAISTATQDSNMNADREEATLKASAVIKQATKIQMAGQRYVAIGGFATYNIGELMAAGLLTPQDVTPPPGVLTQVGIDAGTTYRFGITGFGAGQSFDQQTYHRAIVLENVRPEIALAANSTLRDANDAIFNGVWNGLASADSIRSYAGLPYGHIIQNGLEIAEYAFEELFVGTAHAAVGTISYIANIDFNKNGVNDSGDFYYFSYCVFVQRESCPDADIDGNGQVNQDDWTYFVSGAEEYAPDNPDQNEFGYYDVEGTGGEELLIQIEQAQPEWFAGSGIGGVLVAKPGLDLQSIVNYSHAGEVGDIKAAIMKIF